MRAFAFSIFSVLAVSLSMTALGTAPAFAASDISMAPPEPIYEIDQGERAGFIRSPGYWRWNGAKYAWVPGRWIAARAGYRWVPESWEQHGNKWHFVEGHWDSLRKPTSNNDLDNEDLAAPEGEAPSPLSAGTIDNPEPHPAPSLLAPPSPLAEATSHAPTPKKATKHAPKPSIDYKDPRKWPRVIHH